MTKLAWLQEDRGVLFDQACLDATGQEQPRGQQWQPSKARPDKAAEHQKQATSFFLQSQGMRSTSATTRWPQSRAREAFDSNKSTRARPSNTWRPFI
eukprot:720078-Pelagomonas_calceolata.AAC.2